MKRYLVCGGATNPSEYLRASIAWLESIGGGTVVSDLKSNLMGAMDMNDGSFERHIERLKLCGIKVTWSRKGLPHRGNVIAAFPTKQLIEKLEGRDIDSLLVIGWAESDYAAWQDEHDPALMDIPSQQEPRISAKDKSEL